MYNTMGKIEKYGVAWKDHLPFISLCHEHLSTANAIYISTLGGSFTDEEGNIIYQTDAYANLRGYMAKFFNIVRPLFSKYLEDKDLFNEDWKEYKLKIDSVRDYEKIIEDYECKYMEYVIDATKVLLYWANKHGPFATFVSTSHFKNDEDYMESRE